MVKDWTIRVRRWLLPPTCILCGGTGSITSRGIIDICDGCRNDLPFITTACERCASPITSASQIAGWCGACMIKPPIYQRAHSLFRYAYPVDRLLQRLKFNRRLAYGRVLGTILAERLDALVSPRPQLIIPVPLHRTRLRTRGFNQATELAIPVADRLGIRISTTVCRRIRGTAPQTSLDRVRRRTNVRGAFEIVEPLVETHVAIVDDIVTTGSTVAELARILNKAGVDTIEVWSCARASTQSG